MKTPDEIKDGIKCCTIYLGGGDTGNCCDVCPYLGSCRELEPDTLAYIQQLETERHQLLTKCERLERERDAAVEDISQGSRCAVCRKFFKNGGDCSGGVYCIPLRFEWRGVKEEPHARD